MRDCDAASERRTISACRRAALLGPLELRRPGLEAAELRVGPGEGGLGRVQLEECAGLDPRASARSPRHRSRVSIR